MMIKSSQKNERSRMRDKQERKRRYSSEAASNVLGPKNRGRRLKGDRRKVSTNDPVAPPVMARMARVSSANARARNRGPLKRRYDVALGVRGAEARLPALPVISFGWRFVSGSMFVLMVVCLLNLWSSPAFKIETVQVEGVQRLTQGDINTVIGILGESIFFVSPQEMEENLLKAFPELISAQFKVSLPADVSVKIVEREPVLSLIYKGVEYWIDSEGVAFTPRGDPGKLIRIEAEGELAFIHQAEQKEENPLVTARLTVEPQLVSAVQSIGKIVPEGTLILYDQEHGLGWNDPSGWQVYFGQDDQNIDMKLSVYKSLVENLTQEGIYPTMISVEYVHAPYYRVEQ
jgi:hypothetical protein